MSAIREVLSLKTRDDIDLINLPNLYKFFNTINECENVYAIDFQTKLNKIVIDSKGKIVDDGIDYMESYMEKVNGKYKEVCAVFSEIDQFAIKSHAKKSNLDKLSAALNAVIKEYNRVNAEINELSASRESYHESYVRQQLEILNTKKNQLSADENKIMKKKTEINAYL